VPGRGDVEWQMTVSKAQQGHFKYFAGKYAGETHTRVLWQKKLYYVKRGGGIVMPDGGYSVIVKYYGTPPQISPYQYARSLGY
jgi:hypothetical protein